MRSPLPHALKQEESSHHIFRGKEESLLLDYWKVAFHEESEETSLVAREDRAHLQPSRTTYEFST